TTGRPRAEKSCRSSRAGCASGAEPSPLVAARRIPFAVPRRGLSGIAPLRDAAMLRRLYDWCIDAAGKPHATWIMGSISFAESSFFPIPPDIMLIPMSLARPDRAWFYATVCTLTSVAGGIGGYLIGALLYDSVGAWLIAIYGLGDKVEDFRT